MKIQELISNFTSYDKSAISLNVKGQKGNFLKMHVVLSISNKIVARDFYLNGT